jgi:hypothetical protein
VWIAGVVVTLLHAVRHDAISPTGQGIQLTFTIMAALAVIGVAFLLARDEAHHGPKHWSEHPYLRRLLLAWEVRCWLLLLGLGVPAAVRSLR